MGHYCRICGRQRPNEKFSGHGHKIHVCQECAAMPKAEREAIEQEEEIFGFMHQSHISAKNVQRLKVLQESANARIGNLAEIVLAVAAVTPFKRRRLKILAQKRAELLGQLEETGLIFAHRMD